MEENEGLPSFQSSLCIHSFSGVRREAQEKNFRLFIVCSNRVENGDLGSGGKKIYSSGGS